MTKKIPKSRSLRKVFVKVPGNEVKVHFRERKEKKRACAECGKILPGMFRNSPGNSKPAKTKRKPSRPFGGILCSSCMRKKVQANVLKASGDSNA
ncbi:MAG TPA: 50S ribosomal protein L34e [Candidatus Woesearchaeota archaeon]|nr:50S ribosomal protein L34e [Candidatus Woesearchaeota archaeon]